LSTFCPCADLSCCLSCASAPTTLLATSASAQADDKTLLPMFFIVVSPSKSVGAQAPLPACLGRGRSPQASRQGSLRSQRFSFFSSVTRVVLIQVNERNESRGPIHPRRRAGRP